MNAFLRLTTLFKTFNQYKVITITLLICMFTMNPLILLSQNGDPPPPPGEHGQNGNQPPGGGAPVGDGLMILLTLSAAYLIKKQDIKSLKKFQIK